MTISGSGARADASSRWKFVRWAVSSAMLTFPQAAPPVDFALLGVALTGEASGGRP